MFEYSVKKWFNRVYQISMAIFRRTILIVGMIFGLAFSSSGLCAEASMQPEAMSGMVMENTAAHTLAVRDMIRMGGAVMVVSEDASHAVDTCIFDCANKTPQATLVEKTKISSHAINLLSLYFSDVDSSAQGVLIRGVASGESPGNIASADTLLSVQKRE